MWSRELPATDIADHFADVTRSAISQHLSVLKEASERDLLDFPTAVAKLRKTNFHVAESIIQRALEDDAERRKRS